jgi:hypothetical protein
MLSREDCEILALPDFLNIEHAERGRERIV